MPQILMPYTVHLDHTLRVTPMNTLFAKGDSAAHRFELTILRAGVQEDLRGCTVMCKFYRMADSTVVSVPGSVEDGKAIVALPSACYDYIGRFALTISIQNGDEETTVFYGDGYMHGQRADKAISGEYIIYDIDTLIEKIAEIDAATQAANTATENANTAASNANTARDAANTAASTANTAATNANTAKDAANAAAGKIDAMTVSATPLETGTATAELSTVDGHYHLALGLPKGDTGATPQISVQVQTGEAGSEASVSVSGTAENPVILLTIPRGDVGDIGSLTINGKTPDGSGAVTLTPGDLGAATAEEVSQLKDEIGVHNYTYSGRDLSVIFGTLSALHAAVSAGDFSKIRVGDYWPITLNGSIKDYASGETKTLRNVVFKLEVAPQVYLNYGDTPVPNHLLMCSRDLIPWALMYRSENTTWYDDSQTNPWLGSHLYQTLNASDGILPLVEAIFGSYIYAGPNGNGMRFFLETKASGATSATDRVWGDRGKLFLPTEREVWGQDIYSEHSFGCGAAVQWPMFIGSLKHIIKGLGNGGSRYDWWCQSSNAGSAANFTGVSYHGIPTNNVATATWLSAPLCFLFV